MKIVIKRIPYEKMRYPTLGDYWFDKKGVLQVRVTSHSEDDFWTTLIHELIELSLTRKRKISWKEIDNFDKEHPFLEGPGLDPKAPYHNEHMFSCKIEEIFSKELAKSFGKGKKKRS